MKMHFPIFHYGGDYMLTERFTPSLLSRSLPLSLESSPLCRVDRLSSPRHLVFPLDSFIFLMFSFFFLSCLPVKADQSPAMCISWTDVNIWNSLMSPLEFCWCFNLISLQIHHRILFFFSFFFTPWRMHVLNWINERLLCGLRICAAECLPVVMLDYGNYGIAVWNTRLQSLQHNTRFWFQSAWLPWYNLGAFTC